MPSRRVRAMEVDEALEAVGTLGPFHILLFSCLFLVAAFHGAKLTSGYYFLYNQEHWCKSLTPNNNTVTPGQLRWQSHWSKGKDPEPSDESCFVKNSTDFGFIADSGEVDAHPGMVPCHSWNYDTSVMEWTATRQYDLVCDKRIYASHANMALMVGSLLGGVVFGKISDRFGRKVCFHSALVLFVVFGVGMGWANNFYSFAAMYAISAAASTGIFVSSIVTAMEFVLPKHRKIPGLVMNTFFPIGEMIITGVAFGFRNWTWITVTVTAPAALMFVYIRIVPESIRWLMLQKKYQKVEEILLRMARLNGREVAVEQRTENNFADLLQSYSNEPKEGEQVSRKDSFFDLFKYCRLAQLICFTNFNWLFVNLAYFGLLYNSTDLGQGLFLNCFYVAVVEAPSHILSLFLVDRIGRKKVHLFYYTLIILATAISIVVCFELDDSPQEKKSILLVMTIIGKFAAQGLTGSSFLWMAELYPTSVRTTALGVGSACARVGGILSSYVVEFGNDQHSSLGNGIPYIVICATGVVGFIFCTFLPETSGRSLPATIQEARVFGSEQQVRLISNTGVQRNYRAVEARPLLEEEE